MAVNVVNRVSFGIPVDSDCIVGEHTYESDGGEEERRGCVDIACILILIMDQRITPHLSLRAAPLNLHARPVQFSKNRNPEYTDGLQWREKGK